MRSHLLKSAYTIIFLLYVFLTCQTQLHCTAFIFVCFVNVCITSYIVDHALYINFVYEFIVNFEISYYILHFYVSNFSFVDLSDGY